MKTQISFLDLCRERSSGNFAQEIADLLGVNLDAAYRRIRGATALTLEDTKRLCLQYRISFDSVISFESSQIPFRFTPMFNDAFNIMDYLGDINKQLQTLAQNNDGEFVITAMDLPYFKQFGYTALSRFKLFFWQKSVLHLENLRDVLFQWDDKRFDEYDSVTRSIFLNYNQIPSTEIWTTETIDSALKQVQYYLESGLFADKASAVRICQDILELLERVEEEARLGQKVYSTPDKLYRASFQLYQSDTYLSNNSIQAMINGDVYTYVSFNSFNSLMSNSVRFSGECTRWIEQIRAKSILLSQVSERLRYQFFLEMRLKVEDMLAKAEDYR